MIQTKPLVAALLLLLFVINIVNSSDTNLVHKRQQQQEEEEPSLSQSESSSSLANSAAAAAASALLNSATSTHTTNQHLESESGHSWTVFFILCVLAFSILVIHVLLKFNFHYLPESVAIVFLGAIIGLLFKMLSQMSIADWTKEESFTPTIFFLVLLPPIIFESGYNMHKVTLSLFFKKKI